MNRPDVHQVRPPTAGPGGLTRRRFLGGAGAVLAGAAVPGVSGCAASVRGVGKTVLQVVTVPSELDAPTIAAFERANPDIRISLVQSSWDVVVSMLAANTPPDLVRGAGATETAYLAARGLMEPLDHWIAGSSLIRDDDLDPVNDVWRFDGRVQGKGPRYGLCKDYSADLTLWLDRSAFPSDLPFPDTRRPLSYDDVLRNARRLTKAKDGRTTLGFGAVFAGRPDFSWLMGMMASAGGSPFTEDFTEVDLTTGPGLRVLSWFVEMVKTKSMASFLQPQALDDVSLYVGGRMGMLQSGYWTTGFVGTAAKKLQAASYLTPAPQFGVERVSPCVAGTGMWMPGRSANKEAAWRFMEWYFGGAPAVARSKTGWGTPSLRSMVKYLPRSEPFQQRALATAVGEREYFKVLPTSPYARADNLGIPLAAVFERGVRGNHSVRRIAGDASAQLTRLLRQGKKKVVG